MTKPLLVLGNKNYSSWSMRPYLAIHHTGMDFDEVVLALDTPEFKSQISRYNPAGKVPVLIDDGLAIWDTLAILEYLAERHPSLWPADRATRAQARSISAEMHSGFSNLRQACPMNIRATGRNVPVTAGLQSDIDRIDTIWRDCLERSGGPYLFGQFSNADAMFAPVASRFQTYGYIPSADSSRYVETIHNDPAFVQWRDAALKEDWIVDADEAGA